MTIQISIFTILLIVLVFIFQLFAFLLYVYKTKERFNDLIIKFREENNSLVQKYQLEISKRIQKSKEVIRGSVTEELLPIFPDFPYKMSDCKFSGAPIDYIVFENMSDYRDKISKKPINIIFADVKNNTSSNTPVQNQIKDAILNNRVYFENWLIDQNNKITIKRK